MSETGILFILQVVKSVAVTLIVLFLGVTALALTVNAANLSVSVLHPAVQVIKPLAVLFGSLVAIRGGKGALKGLLSGGAAFFVVWFLLACLAKGSYAFSSAVIDFLAFLLFGVCSGILAVSLKNR